MAHEQLTEGLEAACAAEIHTGQVRKGRGVPYIEHPRAVAGHVARHDGTEDEA